MSHYTKFNPHISKAERKMYVILANGERIGSVVYPGLQIAELTVDKMQIEFPDTKFTIAEK